MILSTHKSTLAAALVGLVFAGAVVAQQLYVASPTATSPSYHYDDIGRFFAAYERFRESGKSASFDAYFENGTTGLKNFEAHFGLTPQVLAEKVKEYPAFFASIRGLEDAVKSREAEFDAMFERLQRLFPDYSMPEVYFLVGGLRAGGQAGDGNYVMVAAEIYTDMPGVDLSEFSADARISGPQDLVHIIAHEAAHVIQEEIQGTERYISIYTEEAQGTLMAYSLREGAANLVAKLVSGGHINEEAEAYGTLNEEELWPIFREQAMGTELGDWFFYTPKQNPEWPRDLGYWMGYRMALKCYEAAVDKQVMLISILKADDPEAFLEECAL